MEPPPLFAFKGFDQFANFENKLQHFGFEKNLANMAHGKIPGAQAKWCWGQTAGGRPCGTPVFLCYFYNKLIGPCQEKIFLPKKKPKWPLPGENFWVLTSPTLGFLSSLAAWIASWRHAFVAVLGWQQRVLAFQKLVFFHIKNASFLLGWCLAVAAWAEP